MDGGKHIMKTLFETTMINTGGRDGAVYSPDNIFYLDVAKPQALGGSATTATNPEQLFAAGYSACFNSALELVLEAGKVEIEKSEVTRSEERRVGKECRRRWARRRCGL